MMAETESNDGPTCKDSAVVQGDHKQVADMAVMLHEAGKRVTISHGNFSTRLYDESEYVVDHSDEFSHIKNADNGVVLETVNDDHTLYVTEHRD